jgi:hypothetical protein
MVLLRAGGRQVREGKMPQRTRIVIGLAVLSALAIAVLGFDQLRRSSSGSGSVAGGEPTLAPGSIPIRLNGRLAGGFNPTDLEQLEMVSFVDAEEGKIQEGWLLRDVLLLYVDERSLDPDSVIEVRSTSRDRSAELTWAEVKDASNWVMFDLSGRGTLKLASVLERLDTRDEWVQDVDGVAITNP